MFLLLCASTPPIFGFAPLNSLDTELMLPVLRVSLLMFLCLYPPCDALVPYLGFVSAGALSCVCSTLHVPICGGLSASLGVFLVMIPDDDVVWRSSLFHPCDIFERHPLFNLRHGTFSSCKLPFGCGDNPISYADIVSFFV